MFNRYMEYKETRQFRQAQAISQNRRQLFVLFPIMGTLLVAISAVKAVMPTEPAKSAVPSVLTTQQKELQDIQRFAVVVTKPLDTLTSEDLDLVGSKAHDPCYESNAMLPAEQMVEAISTCK